MGLDIDKLKKEISCHNCLFWVNSVNDKYTASFTSSTGNCIRNPEKVIKESTEVCSKHPSFFDYATLISSTGTEEEDKANEFTKPE